MMMIVFVDCSSVPFPLNNFERLGKKRYFCLQRENQ